MELYRTQFDQSQCLLDHGYFIMHNTLYYLPLLFYRCKRKRSETREEDPFLSMAREEHKLKMKVLKLKEWKLMHQCTNMGICLSRTHDIDEEKNLTPSCSLPRSRFYGTRITSSPQTPAYPRVMMIREKEFPKRRQLLHGRN